MKLAHEGITLKCVRNVYTGHTYHIKKVLSAWITAANKSLIKDEWKLANQQ